MQDYFRSLRAALTVADVVLIPAKPRSFDLWGVDQTVDLVKEAREINDRLRAITVLNEADTRQPEVFRGETVGKRRVKRLEPLSYSYL